jgi:hypothetical protein
LPPPIRLGKAKPCFLCIDATREAGEKPSELCYLSTPK